MSLVFVALSASFLNGVGLLRAQLVSKSESVRVRLTPEGFVPSEITVEPGSPIDFESLLSVPTKISSEEQDTEGKPELLSPPLSTGQVWTYTAPAHLDGGVLTLSADGLPEAFGMILIAVSTGDASLPGAPTPSGDAPAPVATPPPLPPTLPPPTPVTSIPTPFEPTPTSSPFGVELPATPSVLTLTAPPIEVVQSPSGLPPGFRVNRFTVGSPLVPPMSSDFDGSAWLTTGGSTYLSGQQGAPLHGVAPMMSPEALPASPTPKVARQPRTGPLLGGIILVGVLLTAWVVRKRWRPETASVVAAR